MNSINLRTIEDLELLKESADIECKLAGGKNGQGHLPSAFWDSYSAMANTDGGSIFLGVEEKKGAFTPKGIENPNLIRKQLVDTANNPSKVSVNLLRDDLIQEIEINGITILCITIPRAKRSDKPVFLNGNPLKHSYRRMHEADQRMPEELIKRLLGEQSEDSIDSSILMDYDLSDIDSNSLKAYRQAHSNLNTGHEWNNRDDQDFLRGIGAWKKDRATGREGLTKAGLLMFGKYESITDVYPNFCLDYQERVEKRNEKNSNRRWLDRVFYDGSWSGNIYDFFRKVYPKLVADLKLPFEIKDGKREDDTPAHIALRESLVNCLIHADYRGGAKVLVIKRPDLFGFMNPGHMRIPLSIALDAEGESDCRNKKLQGMFNYIKLGERSGTGMQKIYEGAKINNWKKPSLIEESEPSDRTLLTIYMVDLFPAYVMELLPVMYELEFQRDFDTLDRLSKLALALAYHEDHVVHSRLKELSGEHSSEVSKCLKNLVDLKVLTKSGKSKGTVYYLSLLHKPMRPEDVFHSIEDNKGVSKPINDGSQPISGSSQPISGSSQPISGSSQPIRDISEQYDAGKDCQISVFINMYEENKKISKAYFSRSLQEPLLEHYNMDTIIPLGEAVKQQSEEFLSVFETNKSSRIKKALGL